MESHIFISSCSRRQMARRRGSRGTMRGVIREVAPVLLQLLVALLVLAVAFGAFVVGRGGV